MISITAVGFILILIFNGKELFGKLNLDKVYLNRRKQVEKKYKIDLELNESKTQEFDEKYGINKPINKYIEKLQYGNKVFNTEETEEDENSKFKNNEALELKDKKIINLTNPQMLNAGLNRNESNENGKRENKENTKLNIYEGEITIHMVMKKEMSGKLKLMNMNKFLFLIKILIILIQEY